ncbi:phosphoribose diphosphate:decaprenyl-phosphate phosphoribosyltransferase [Mycolicibacterium neworleansense]|uniref:Phosphoribose diphosphate:decaprenyl-phosphate phosphoribosyltransferase n=1 Tax=Mycolicibacterium neworleansense TaxID=146018 RepID=A0A0H5RKS1_9MYCO|nr:phosphoribose diphosphate:decaprenyl-phosphate phosphoribosyltransferase [Mycolicibacterium neworleansense]
MLIDCGEGLPRIDDLQVEKGRQAGQRKNAVGLGVHVAIASDMSNVVYLAIQLGYCVGLKHQAVVDICIISSAYLMRAIAGEPEDIVLQDRVLQVLGVAWMAIICAAIVSA